ncbi:MAG: serine hydrolase domain-containing protein [Mycobacterium leprae]
MIPTTPAGQQLQAFLDFLRTPAPERIGPHIAEHEGRDEPWLEAAYGNYLHDFGGLRLQFIRVVESTDYRLTMVAQSEPYDLYIKFEIGVSPEPPHRIEFLWPYAILRPADLPPLPALTEQEMLRTSSELLQALAQKERFSGSLLIAKDGVPLLQEAWGLASRAYQIPNRIDTKFNLASMNKMFTAVATLQLVQEGKLNLTDPVARHLPHYPKPAADQITIHHLLSHTSGLGSFWNEQWQQAKARLRTVADFLPLFQDEPLTYQPGERYQYGNNAFVLLGAIIEAVSGEDYFDYVRDHVYRPAGMVDTDAYPVDEDVPNLAMGYTHIDYRDQFHPDRLFNILLKHVAKGGPAGGGFSTAPDLLGFAEALMAHRLLSPELTELLVTNKSGDHHYAYGFEAQETHRSRVVGHAGGHPGISTYLDIFPDRGYVVVALGNCDGPATYWVRDKIRELIDRIP